ncbi:MAG TPA: diguanylate cyclase [Herpetosiphonaceae bacterium]|nr:diguanylate cyclase [Herpetosiphonaceae bacterium]
MTKPLVLPRPGRHANARQPLGRDRARRLIKELNALHEIGRAISRAWHLSDVLETIYVQTSRLMDTRHLYIALYHAEQNIIEFALARENGKRVDWPPREWGRGLTEWLMENKRPLRISSESLAQDMAPIVFGAAPKSFLGVPILLGDAVLGVLSVQSTEQSDAFSSRDEYILTMIADQAAVAIAHAQRFAAVDQQLQQRVAQLEALEATVRDLNETLDVSVILNRLLERACVTVGADAGMVTLITEDRQSLIVKAIRGYPEEIQYYQKPGWSINRGLAGYVARTGQPDFCPDVRRSPYYAASRPSTLSQISVPIIHNTVVLGVLVLESDHLGTFSLDLTRFIVQIADHAALSIHNARIHEQAVQQQHLLTQRSQQLGEVLRISQALSANLNLDVLLPEIVGAIRSSLGFGIALLSLIDKDDPTMMRRRAEVGVPPAQWEMMKGQLVPISWYEGVMREEFRISRSYYIPHSHAEHAVIWDNSENDIYRPDLGERGADEWQSDDALFVPLFDSDGRLISVLSVDDPHDRHTPSFDSVQVLEIFASQAAIAIENASLYATTQELAITDGLTGLYNQRHFITMLEREVAVGLRYAYPLSLLALDLDHFKQYNDTFGHLAGNVLLRDFAAVLRANVRDVDVIARVGGEEFVIIVPKTDEHGAMQLAERLRVSIAAQPFLHRRVTVSIGVASLHAGMDATMLHHLADQALYDAKRSGRNAVMAAPTMRA